MPGLRQYKRSYNAYDGLAESAVTSNPLFWGDAAMITLSWTTSSGTASKLTLEGFDGGDADGFRIALPSGAQNTGGWQLLKPAMTAQGYYSVDTIPSFARFLRTPSTSSMSVVVSMHVGP